MLVLCERKHHMSGIESSPVYVDAIFQTCGVREMVIDEWKLCIKEGSGLRALTSDCVVETPSPRGLWAWISEM